MLTVKIPEDLDNRLEIVADKLGRTKDDIVLSAIAEEIEDIEDGLIALERIQRGDNVFYSLDEVRERLGLGRSTAE